MDGCGTVRSLFFEGTEEGTLQHFVETGQLIQITGPVAANIADFVGKKVTIEFG